MAELKPCVECQFWESCSVHSIDAIYDRVYERNHGRDCWVEREADGNE
jgi:hypothetical protein